MLPSGNKRSFISKIFQHNFLFCYIIYWILKYTDILLALIILSMLSFAVNVRGVQVSLAKMFCLEEELEVGQCRSKDTRLTQAFQVV